MAFQVALQFLTRIPTRIQRDVNLDELGASIAWFPAVGALIGLLLVAANSLLSPLLHRPAVDALLLTMLIALTGALHLDGVIDTADGLTRSLDRAGRLAVMREAHTGPVGAVAGIAMVLATYAALSGLSGPARASALFIAPVAGRTAILLGYYLYPYGRAEATASAALKRGATTAHALLGLASAAALAAAAGALGGLAVLAVSLLALPLLAMVAVRRIGGVTGDVVGAACESCQLLALVVAPFLLRP